jgi:zinc D-Ala-D-Ala carboxypeptidase
MKVGTFFTLDEFTTSQTAARLSISNNPSAKALDAIQALCLNILDPLRGHLGRPIVVSSGYRSPALNKAVPGSSTTSQHCKGEAADILCPGLTVADVIKVIRELELPFDQLLDEYGSWTHVSYGPRNRREVLMVRRKKGEVVYRRIQ